MEELGFTSLASDAGVFYYRGEDSFIVIIIYVNNAIFCGPSKSLILKLKEVFTKRWETQDLGEVTESLHMHITRQGSSIHLDQCAYLKTVLDVECKMLNLLLLSQPDMSQNPWKSRQIWRDKVGSKP